MTSSWWGADNVLSLAAADLGGGAELHPTGRCDRAVRQASSATRGPEALNWHVLQRSSASVRQSWRIVMVTNGTVVPRRAKTLDTVSLTNWQKVIGVCLLLFYLAMIVITTATLPYVANVAIPHLTIFVP
jgi:hypothetical protein